MFTANQQATPFGGQSTGAFGGNNNLFGSPTNTPMLAKQSGAIFGNNTPAQIPFGTGIAAQPLFGGSNATQPFGANTATQPFGANTATQPFGNTNQGQPFGGNPMTPQQPLFGNPQGFGNQQTTTTAFGGNPPTGGTLFLNAPSGQNNVNGQTGGIFPSNNPQQNGVQGSQINNGSMFGTNDGFGNNAPANNLFGAGTGGNLFGQAANTGFPQQTNQANPFGQQQQANSLPQQNNAFGNQNNTLFGNQPASNNLFAGNQNSAFKSSASTNPFGSPSFGQSMQQNVNSTSAFGQNTAASNNPFGLNQQNQGNNLFGTNPQTNSILNPQIPTMASFNTNQSNPLQQPINPMASITLGGNTPATSNNFAFGTCPSFGGGTNMTNPSLFGANNTNANTNIFNAGQLQANQNKPANSWLAPTNASTFGTNSPLNTGYGTNSNGGFFGNTQGNTQNTSFPMATNNKNDKFGGTSWGVPNLNTNFQQPEQFKPVRTKNPKLDSKHLVKCISALDQFEGQCKEQIRLAFISSGGQQIIHPQANTPVNNFNKSNNLTTNNSLGSSNGFNTPAQLPSFGAGLNTSNNFFGANMNAAQNPASNTMFGQNNGQNMSFGQISTANNALFEAKTNNGFGSTGTPSKAPLFGASPFNSQQSNTFNSTPTPFGVNVNTQKSTSLFGQNSGALLNQAANAAGFFQNSNANNQQIFLGQQNTAVGANNSAFGLPAQNSLFGTPTPTGQTGFFGQANSNMNPSGLMPMNNGMNNGMGMSQMSNAMTNMNPSYQNPMAGTYNLQNSFGNLYGSQSLTSDQILTRFNSCFSGNQSVFNLPASQMSPQGFLSSQPNMDVLATLLASLNAQGFSVSQNLIAQTTASTPFDKLIAQQPVRPQFETRKDTDLATTTPTYKDVRSYVIPTLDFDLRDVGLNRSESASRISRNQPEMKMKRVNSDERLYPFQNVRKEKESSSISLSTVKYENIPILCGFTISPNLQVLKSMNALQISSVKDVRISNAFGSIQFKQKINLNKKNLSHCIKIEQDCIQVLDSEWEVKKCELTFKNFGGYLDKNEDEREKVIKKMNKWVAKMNMKIIKHDTKSGDLVVCLD